VRKEIQKKEKEGRRCWADPPPFRPDQPRGPLLPASPRARTRPPFSTRRRPRGGCTSATWPRPPGSDRHNQVGTLLHSPRRPIPSVTPSFASHSPRQGHRRARLLRGKPLRTLYRGESHVRARIARRSSLDLVGVLCCAETLPLLLVSPVFERVGFGML
jgi:hypothetical protein